jgi:hypothetical protein
MTSGAGKPIALWQHVGVMLLVFSVFCLGLGGRLCLYQPNSARAASTNAMAKMVVEQRSPDVLLATVQLERPRFTRESLEISGLVLALGLGFATACEKSRRESLRVVRILAVVCRPYLSLRPPPALV